MIHLARSLQNKKGLEIGGPSHFFKPRTYFPVYLFADVIDCVNFGNETIWEGSITEGKTFEYLKGYNKGTQYVSEASELSQIENNKYDFLLSCHSLEHLANPLKALKRWNEVLKPGGELALVLPNKEVTFDINRPYTNFDHLVQDFENNVSENDTTHFAEILALHEMSRNPEAKNFEDFKDLINNNFQQRCAHHHVFSFDVIKKMLEYSGFEVRIQKIVYDLHLFSFAKKRT